jgi:hypothetical protein
VTAQFHARVQLRDSLDERYGFVRREFCPARSSAVTRLLQFIGEALILAELYSGLRRGRRPQQERNTEKAP